MTKHEPKYDRSGIPHYGKDKPYEYNENKFQEATARLLRLFPGISALHVPNERSGKVSKYALFALERQGVRPGASDCSHQRRYS